MAFQKEIRKKEWFLLEEHRKRVGWYDTTRLWGSTPLCGSSKCQTVVVRSKDAIDRVCNSLYKEMRWYEMIRNDVQDAGCDASCLPRDLPNIYSPSLCSFLLPLYPGTPVLPSRSLSFLYLHTSSIDQSSAKLSGCGGEKQIFLPQGTLGRGVYIQGICVVHHGWVSLHILSLSAKAPPAWTARLQQLSLHAICGFVECWWWAVRPLDPRCHHTIIEWTSRCTVRPWSYKLGGHTHAS